MGSIQEIQKTLIHLESQYHQDNWAKKPLLQLIKGLEGPVKKREGEFWSVLIPKSADYVLKIPKKSHKNLASSTSEDFKLITKYLGEFIVRQETIVYDESLLILQEKVPFAFQISFATFDRTFSKDLLAFKIFTRVNSEFRCQFSRFADQCSLMHEETNKIIDMWGSGNVVFNFPHVTTKPVLIDTTFLFHEIADTTPKTRDERYMKEGHEKSMQCLNNMLEIIGK